MPIYTVSRELGHGFEAMVKRVYGHLGQVRHRAGGVEYRLRSSPLGSGWRAGSVDSRPMPRFSNTPSHPILFLGQ